ncbi:hypothetical protein HMPREF1635_03095 [Clostridiales bacterium S5-A14a]|nr:hypothetical protein HMPREF1635_03095 [Clostridiales bacterium S5-A14a]
MYNKYDSNMLKADRKSLLKILTIIALIFCCAMLPACGNNSKQDDNAKNTDTDKDGKDKPATNEWVEVKNEEDYTKLIDGKVSVENLQTALLFLDAPKNADEIKDLFNDYGNSLIPFIFEKTENTVNDVPGGMVHYVYDIDEINKTISGITTFQFEKNKKYQEENGFQSYTDDKNYHDYVQIIGATNMGHIVIKNGRYNNDVLEINFENQKNENMAGEDEVTNIKPCRATFKKNKNGKFTLDSIIITADE